MSDVRGIFLETAARFGGRIARDALWSGDRCTWIGGTMDVVGNQWAGVERTLGVDLYGGTSGVALFCARLYEQTGEELFRVTAEGALRQSWARRESVPPSIQASFYSGRAGVAYALLVAGEALDRESLVERGLELMRDLRSSGESIEQWDLLSGVAGSIPFLLGLHRRDPAGGWLDLALRYGEAIVQAAHRSDGGASWEAPGQPDQRHLLGFAHGASGIGWALLELHAATSERRFREVGEEAFAYERRWFNVEEGNWPDFRETPIEGATGQPSYMSAWCHGAPGIGLARLRAFRLLGDPILRTEAVAAVASAGRMTEQMLDSPYANYSLCHGLGSFGELLLEAQEVLGDADSRQLAERIGRAGIETFERERLPWPGGVNGGGETPNLMLGSAGIGYYLLRLADAEAVPSVLLVAPESIAAVPRPVG